MDNPAMKPLEPPDSMHLNAAEGWLELGNHPEANEELEKVTPSLRAHPDVLATRWHIYAHARNWGACVDIAAAIIQLDDPTPATAIVLADEAWTPRTAGPGPRPAKAIRPSSRKLPPWLAAERLLPLVAARRTNARPSPVLARFREPKRSAHARLRGM